MPSEELADRLGVAPRADEEQEVSVDRAILTKLARPLPGLAAPLRTGWTRSVTEAAPSRLIPACR